MDYNQLAQDIIRELKGAGIRRTDAQIAERLGISRQAYMRRRDTNSLTTEDITILSAWLVTAFGGGFYLDKYFMNEKYRSNRMNNVNKVILTEEQIACLVRLINDELELNKKSGGEAYNTYLENIKMALGYAITK